MKSRIILVPALIFIVLVCWAMASPVGSSPDDDFHLSSIWCADGSKEGICRVYENKDVVGVPALVGRGSDCYRRNPNQSAACQKIYPRVSDKTDAVTNHFNKGLYPKLYFRVMHSLTGADILFATFSMRILNISLFCFLITAIFVLGRHELRAPLAWSWLACSVPLGLFLIASNNPSSWTITGIGCLFMALLGYLGSSGRSKVIFAFLAIVCCAMALGSRADASVYVVTTLIVSAMLAKLDRPKLTDIDVHFFVLMALVAIFTFFTSSQGQFVLEHGLGATGVNRDPTSVFWFNLMRLPELWFGGLGIYPLGWMDTPMPGTVAIGTFGVFFIIAAAGIQGMWVRKRLTVLLLLLAITAVPMWVLMKPLNLIPENVQARYILPLFYLLMGTMTLKEAGDQISFSRVIRLTITLLLSISHSVALFINIKRYVTGLDVISWNLNRNTEWWDWWPVAPMIVWGIASLSFLVMAYFVVEHISAQPRKAPEAS